MPKVGSQNSHTKRQKRKTLCSRVVPKRLITHQRIPQLGVTIYVHISRPRAVGDNIPESRVYKTSIMAILQAKYYRYTHGVARLEYAASQKRRRNI